MSAANPTIGFVGLSHLGICSMAAAASRGFSAVGYDPDIDRIAALKRGDPPVLEPGLKELISLQVHRLTFSADTETLRACDIVYVSLDVPTNEEGESDLAPIRDMVSSAIARLRSDAILVVLCQVPPGFTRSLALPGERRFYQVETLVFGQAVERATKPERFIVGCEKPDRPLDPRLMAFLSAFDCPVLPMRYESAELAKISANICLIASISVANVMAEICEKIGADWSEIAPALKLDRRIGQFSYLSAGLGISGGNLERDLTTVRRLAEANGTPSDVVKAWQDNSRYRKDWAWRMLRDRLLAEQPSAAIALWGLAYKENTRSTKNSPALALLSHLAGRKIAAYDPVVSADSVDAWLVASGTPLDAVVGADALCIMTPWPEFRSVAPIDIATRMRGRIVLDPYRMLDAAAAKSAGLKLATLGAPPSLDA